MSTYTPALAPAHQENVVAIDECPVAPVQGA
jgi:hypothetical protein